MRAQVLRLTWRLWVGVCCQVISTASVLWVLHLAPGTAVSDVLSCAESPPAVGVAATACRVGVVLRDKLLVRVLLRVPVCVYPSVQQNAGSEHKGKFSRLTYFYSPSGKANSFPVSVKIQGSTLEPRVCMLLTWIPAVSGSVHRSARQHIQQCLYVKPVGTTSHLFAVPSPLLCARRMSVPSCLVQRTPCTTRTSSATSAAATQCTRQSRCGRGGGRGTCVSVHLCMHVCDGELVVGGWVVVLCWAG